MSDERSEVRERLDRRIRSDRNVQEAYDAQRWLVLSGATVGNVTTCRVEYEAMTPADLKAIQMQIWNLIGKVIDEAKQRQKDHPPAEAAVLAHDPEPTGETVPVLNPPPPAEADAP